MTGAPGLRRSGQPGKDTIRHRVARRHIRSLNDSARVGNYKSDLISQFSREYICQYTLPEKDVSRGGGAKPKNTIRRELRDIRGDRQQRLIQIETVSSCRRRSIRRRRRYQITCPSKTTRST